MTQKVVIKLSMNDHASRFFFCFSPKGSHNKALRLAAGFKGVQSVKLVSDRDQIEVTGEIDAVDLATLLRKKVRFAEIVSVGEAKKEDKSKDKQPVIWACPPRQVYVGEPYPEPWCWPL